MLGGVHIYLTLALLPAFFLMYYVYKHDVHEKEPPKVLLNLFFLGVLSAIPAILLESLGELLIAVMRVPASLMPVVVATMVGLVEEGCKFFFLYTRTWHDPNFNYRFDGIVYAVFVSLGFAAIENVMYVFQFGLGTALLRAVLAVPAHMGFAVIMGIFYGRAKQAHIRGDQQEIKRNLILAYVVPVFLHAFYDACALSESTVAFYFFVAFVVAMYIIIYRLIKQESLGDKSLY